MGLPESVTGCFLAFEDDDGGGAGFCVGEGEMAAGGAEAGCDFGGGAGEFEGGRAALVGHHLDIVPAAAGGEAGAEGLEGCFLGGEAGGEAQIAVGGGEAVIKLAVCEEAVEEALAPALARAADARNFDNVDADADDHWKCPGSALVFARFLDQLEDAGPDAR